MISLSKLKKVLNKFPTIKKAHAKGFSSPVNLLKEEKAQAEAVFRLMIDSVIGFAILLVIISALNYFQGQVIVQSKADLISLVKNAVNTPTGIILKSNELTFPTKYAVTVIDLRNWTNLSENCFLFDSRGSITTNADKTKVEVTQAIKTIVYATCDSMPGCNPRKDPESRSECCNICTVSFGKPILIN